ncbi:unnamed protein product [Allacma fusca]|uniref:C2H2-type domain-containing protein n=1 Tax=Allacma fusca TaxID=39272 RepID=A0A8J2LJR6_9HEXA|nr:unnamed protein product [Allacma fusca]
MGTSVLAFKIRSQFPTRDLDRASLRKIMKLVMRLVEKNKVRITNIGISPYKSREDLKEEDVDLKKKGHYRQNWNCYVCAHQPFKNEKDLLEHCSNGHDRQDLLTGLVHTVKRENLKKYECRDCGKIFSRSSHLKTHLVVHTKEKTFECRVCNKLFRYTCTLKKHKKMFHGALP